MITSLGVLRNAKPSLDKIYLDLKELEKPEVVKYLEMTHSSNSGKAVEKTNSSLNDYEVDKLNFAESITLKKVNYSYPESDSNA